MDETQMVDSERSQGDALRHLGGCSVRVRAFGVGECFGVVAADDGGDRDDVRARSWDDRYYEWRFRR